MSNKLPQSTGVLISRLQRVARWFDSEAANYRGTPQAEAAMNARANTCWQAAARLEELHQFYATLPDRFMQELNRVK